MCAYARRFPLQPVYTLLNLSSRLFQAFEMSLLLAPLLVVSRQGRRVFQRSNFSIDVVPKTLGFGQALYLGYAGEEDVERLRVGSDRDCVGSGFDGCFQ